MIVGPPAIGRLMPPGATLERTRDERDATTTLTLHVPGHCSVELALYSDTFLVTLPPGPLGQWIDWHAVREAHPHLWAPMA